MSRPIRTLLRRRRESRGQAVILMYHSISRGRPDPWNLCVDPEFFAEHLDLLRDRFRVLSLHALGEALAAGKTLSRAVVITFDDGYRDNFVVAKPLLEREALPATVFVTTGYLNAGRDFWWDELEALSASTGLPSRPVWKRLQPLAHKERLETLDQMWETAAAPRPKSYLPLSVSELESLAESANFEIGAHTVTHPHLSTLPPDRQEEEICSSQSALSEITGRRVTAFSYPHGDYSQQTVELVRSAGFETACTTRSAPVGRRRTQPLALPRLQVGNWGADVLERELSRRLA